MLNDLLQIIKLCLATYRLTIMIHDEDGPGDIFKLFRKAIGIEEVERPEGPGITTVAKEIIDDNFFSQLVSCVYCLSGWVALLLMAMPQKVVDWLAIWGGVALILRREE